MALPRVLALSSSPSNGGAERHTVTLAAAYQAHGGCVSIACPPGSFTETNSNNGQLATHPFQLRNSGDLRAVVHLARLLRTTGSELLHSHARRDFVTATLAGKLARRPVVLHVHVVRPLGEPRNLAGRFFNQVNAIVTVSDFARRELERWHPLRPGLTRRLYNGIETQVFAHTPTNLLRPSWGIADDSLVIGMVGRLTTKGQLSFLPTAARLAAQFPQLHFVFVGPDAPELSRAEFERQLSSAGLAGRAMLLGMSDQIPQVMRSLDILVHLPTDEAFGLALAEAGAAGVPVVASQVGGCIEIVDEGKTGFLVAPGDTTLLHERLHQLLTDSSLRQRLGATAQLRTQTLFSAERQIKELCALYEEVLR